MKARMLILGLLGAGVLGGLLWMRSAPPDDGQAAKVRAMAEAWDGDIRFEATYSALDPAAADAEGALAAFNPADAYGGLPRNGVYELVANSCGACHSLQLVMQQRRSEARWRELVGAMINVHGMPAPAPEDRRAIEAYLAANFGEAP